MQHVSAMFSASKTGKFGKLRKLCAYVRQTGVGDFWGNHDMGRAAEMGQPKCHRRNALENG